MKISSLIIDYILSFVLHCPIFMTGSHLLDGPICLNNVFFPVELFVKPFFLYFYPSLVADIFSDPLNHY